MKLGWKLATDALYASSGPELTGIIAEIILKQIKELTGHDMPRLYFCLYLLRNCWSVGRPECFSECMNAG